MVELYYFIRGFLKNPRQMPNKGSTVICTEIAQRIIGKLPEVSPGIILKESMKKGLDQS